MVDHSNMKLGRVPAKKDSRTLRLRHYLAKDLPAAPAAKDWTRGIANWGEMLNDIHQDCTIAAAAHAVQVWSANTTGEVTLPDSVILSYYEKWIGYKPGDPATDTGGAELDVLKQWKNSSFHGHKLIAFADVAFHDLDEIRQAIALFGGVYAGFNLPKTAMKQAIWDVVPDGGDDAKPGSWSGHAAFVPKYDERSFSCITWGKVKPMTLAFWKTYVEEAHVLLSPDWLTAKGAPAGFHLEQLKKDLAAIA